MKAQVISFHCVLRDRIGQIISSTFNRDVITSTKPKGEPLRGLAEGLKNLKKGEKRQIFLSADQAYGFYEPELVMRVPRRQLPYGGGDLVIGQHILTETSGGISKVLRVIEINEDSVLLDGNHPLAGHDLTFDIEALEARDATSDEIIQSSLKDSLHLIH